MSIEKQRLITEIATQLAAEITAEITTEITTEVLAEVAGGLRYHLQIWLVIPVVQVRQGLKKMSQHLSWTGLRIFSKTQELPSKL